MRSEAVEIWSGERGPPSARARRHLSDHMFHGTDQSSPWSARPNCMIAYDTLILFEKIGYPSVHPPRESLVNKTNADLLGSQSVCITFLDLWCAADCI
jgi:hypothetical protein